MGSKHKGPIRRAQLIAPFGTGALVVTRDGISVIGCGLDHWYKTENDRGDEHIKIDEFEVGEWRLQKFLGVDFFREPPDYRSGHTSQENTELTIPFLRFPTWHYCNYCNRMAQSQNTNKTDFTCAPCSEKTKFKRPMVQVPFIGICPNGHIQEFPFREWLHRDEDTQCEKMMKIKGVGMTNLSNVKLSCDCGVEPRSLTGILNESNGKTTLSRTLSDNSISYLCKANRPWHNDRDPEGCEHDLKGSLRSASNVYYINTTNAIYIPTITNKKIEKIVNIFKSYGSFKVAFELLDKKPLNEILSYFKENRTFWDYLKKYSDEEILRGIAINSNDGDTSEINVPRSDNGFKFMEYEVLQDNLNSADLMIKTEDIKLYKSNLIENYFSKINLIDKLRETRVFNGFSRIVPAAEIDRTKIMNQLFKKQSPKGSEWLPCYKVYGEGIFFDLKMDILNKWENEDVVIKRTEKFIKRINEFKDKKGLPRIDITDYPPRYFLLHTLSHLLLNQLTFDCGYSTSSLNERVYGSVKDESKMAGLLLYTAAGDTDGTMGGLVKMGSPGFLEAVLLSALDNAKWCSSDPVCMEVGETGGQGVNSLNLAACHNCCLIPENACEQFNVYLDRALVIGSRDNPRLGFFNYVNM